MPSLSRTLMSSESELATAMSLSVSPSRSAMARAVASSPAGKARAGPVGVALVEEDGDIVGEEVRGGDVDVTVVVEVADGDAERPSPTGSVVAPVIAVPLALLITVTSSELVFATMISSSPSLSRSAKTMAADRRRRGLRRAKRPSRLD